MTSLNNLYQFDAYKSGKRTGSSPLDHGGGGPHDPGMESRVTRLEVEFEYVRRDLDEIKDTLKEMNTRFEERFRELPTKRDLTVNLQWIVGSAIAVIALFIAVLTYLQDQRIAGSSPSPASPAPIVIQLPPIPALAPVTPQVIVPQTPPAK